MLSNSSSVSFLLLEPFSFSLKYRVDPHETQSKGGCSTFRSLDLHNESMKQLQQKFPSFVKLKEKIAKNSGEWSNKIKLAAIIQWKKAYQSSQTNNLEGFMNEWFFKRYN